jgi:hypothetical protein
MIHQSGDLDWASVQQSIAGSADLTGTVALRVSPLPALAG